MNPVPVRVTVWSEGHHERSTPGMGDVYPDGIHPVVAEGLRQLLPEGSVVREAWFQQPEHGLTDEILADTDVLVWWGHQLNQAVDDEIVNRVWERVMDGMGLIALHSAHVSKIFLKLMGTRGTIWYRNDKVGERMVTWPAMPGHPINAGIDKPIVLDPEEPYCEPFDVPTPDEVVLLSSFTGGEVFRAGITYRRGNGKVFYFSPGHETYRTYFDPSIRRVIANAVLWARADEGLVPSYQALEHERLGWLHLAPPRNA